MDGSFNLGDLADKTVYSYDAAGRMKMLNGDSPGNDSTVWRPDNRPQQITAFSQNANFYVVNNHYYLYDANGDQVRDINYSYWKSISTGTLSQVVQDTTYSVYDANHVKVASYLMQTPLTGTTDRMLPSERYIYGSDRLATIQRWNQVGTNVVYGIFSVPWVWGPSSYKDYEMKDHLGNIRATILGTTQPIGGGAVMVPASAFNYYTYGQLENYYSPGSNEYSFSFNGQQRNDDVAGLGNHNTALYWEYGTREGRRWNRDLQKNPWESDYAVFGDNPITTLFQNNVLWQF
ncbi:MAG TPA: hypothetical protein VHA52_04450 [Candidatus Babeliaceae bacterium]|nr:hypothetical protein [Candidatus Babeliaceae bacterium]